MGDRLIDRATAKSVQLQIDNTGRVWLNVDGVCTFRCGQAESVTVEANDETKEYRTQQDFCKCGHELSLHLDHNDKDIGCCAKFCSCEYYNLKRK